jgi:hypothetical protein
MIEFLVGLLAGIVGHRYVWPKVTPPKATPKSGGGPGEEPTDPPGKP